MKKTLLTLTLTVSAFAMTPSSSHAKSCNPCKCSPEKCAESCSPDCSCSKCESTGKKCGA